MAKEIKDDKTVKEESDKPVKPKKKEQKEFEHERLLSPERVAEILDVSPNTVRAWLRDRVMGGTKLGGKMWRIRESDLENFLKMEFPEDDKPDKKEPETMAYIIKQKEDDTSDKVGE